MLTDFILLNINSAWEDFYPTSTTKPSITGVTSNTHYVHPEKSNRCYICQASFVNIDSGNISGAALSVYNAKKILIESCSFANCHTNLKGGAVYFIGNNAKKDPECILSKVCSTNCYSTKEGFQFCYINFFVSCQTRNNIEDSSISQTNTNESDCNIFLDNGKVTFHNNNVSFITCQDYSVFGCAPSKDAVVSQTTFINNSNADLLTNTAVYFERSKTTVNINHLNMINTQTKENGFYYYGKTTVEDSLFLNNNIGKDFFCCYGDGTVNIIRCTLDNKRYQGFHSPTFTECTEIAPFSNAELNQKFDSYVEELSDIVCPGIEMSDKVTIKKTLSNHRSILRRFSSVILLFIIYTK